MRISDWSSDVCSSDLRIERNERPAAARQPDEPLLALDLPFGRDDLGDRTDHGQAARALEPRRGRVADTHLRKAKGGADPAAQSGEQHDGQEQRPVRRRRAEIGRAACRERVWRSVEISVVAGYLKKKNNTMLIIPN